MTVAMAVAVVAFTGIKGVKDRRCPVLKHEVLRPGTFFQNLILENKVLFNIEPFFGWQCMAGSFWVKLMDIDWGCEKSVCPRDQQIFQVVKGDR